MSLATDNPTNSAPDASASVRSHPHSHSQQGPVDWAHVRRQIGGIVRLELRQNLFSRRSFATYFLALAPIALIGIWSITPLPQKMHGSAAQALQVTFPLLFEALIRTSIFLSALILFMSLFRSEILEKSLHYYFLTPVRREVLVAGKYLSALVAMSVLFMLSTIALYTLTGLPWGLGTFLRILDVGDLIAYLGVVVLACAGYGAVFLLVGLFFRNPIVPAAAIWGWELINFLLPPLLKKASVIHYLQSLYPMPLPSSGLDGFFAQLFEVVVEPTPAWLSVPGILIFTGLVLAFAGWRARRMEINYGGD